MKTLNLWIKTLFVESESRSVIGAMAEALAALIGVVLVFFGLRHGQVILSIYGAFLMVIALWRSGAVRRGGLAWAAPILIGLGAFLLQPDLTDDHHRYLWEGFVQWQGYSPYQHAPADLYSQLDHPSEGKVNNDTMTAIYPPLAQYLFAIAALFGSGFYAWKVLAMLSLAIAIPLCGRRRGLVLLTAAPVLIEGLWNAHLDVLCLTPMALLLHALERDRPRDHLVAGLALGVMTAIKLMPVVFLPYCLLHLRRSQWFGFLAAFCGVLAVCYAPWLGQIDDVFASFLTFSKQWYFNNPFFHLLRLALSADHARLVLSGLLAVSLGLIAIRRADLRWRLTAVWIAFLCFSPTVHPWYLIWLVALVDFPHIRYAFGAYAAALLAYSVLPRYRAEGVWQESAFILAIEWLVLLLIFGKLLVSVKAEPPS